MDSEDGKNIYSEFVNAQKKWYDYIRPVCIENFNKRLVESGKTYNKYSYFSNTISNVLSKPEKPENIKKLYKKLSLIFHPDKCNKTHDIFIAITKFAENNDIESLEYIDKLSDYILENSENNDLINILKTKEKIKEFYEFIQKDGNNINNFVLDHNEYTHDLTQTIAYQWYMGNDNIKNSIESMYWTEDELINHLKNDYLIDIEREYYMTTGTIEIQKILIMRLKKENEELQENIDKYKNILEMKI
jgi:hypothetical protein